MGRSSISAISKGPSISPLLSSWVTVRTPLTCCDRSPSRRSHRSPVIMASVTVVVLRLSHKHTTKLGFRVRFPNQVSAKRNHTYGTQNIWNPNPNHTYGKQNRTWKTTIKHKFADITYVLRYAGHYALIAYIWHVCTTYHSILFQYIHDNEYVTTCHYIYTA